MRWRQAIAVLSLSFGVRRSPIAIFPWGVDGKPLAPDPQATYTVIDVKKDKNT